MIGRLVGDMRAAGEDAETVNAFERLADPKICAAIDGVIRDRYPLK